MSGWGGSAGVSEAATCKEDKTYVRVFPRTRAVLIVIVCVSLSYVLYTASDILRASAALPPAHRLSRPGLVLVQPLRDSTPFELDRAQPLMLPEDLSSSQLTFGSSCIKRSTFMIERRASSTRRCRVAVSRRASDTNPYSMGIRVLIRLLQSIPSLSFKQSFDWYKFTQATAEL